MVYEESGDGSDGYGADITEDIANVNAFGEDFDDFEEGALEDDFGDFNEEFQQPPSPKKQESKPADSDGALPSYISPFVSKSITNRKPYTLCRLIIALMKNLTNSRYC